jgi:uncharacterized protein
VILQAMSHPAAEHEPITLPNTQPVTTVDLNAFCDAGKFLSGRSAADEFGALDEYVEGSLQAVEWQIQGSHKPVPGAQFDKTMDANYRFLTIKASTQVGATCGRCLNAMTLTLAVDTQLQAFQTDEAADSAAMTPEADALPDPIVASRTFDLLDQVQEELLLAMPDNPMHAENDPVCVLPAVVNNEQASAFAVLASLKKAK